MSIPTRIKCRNPIWTSNFTLSVLGVIFVVVAFLLLSNDDLQQQERVEAHKAETIAAARLAAHERANQLRKDGLLDRANAMLAPCCQAVAK